MTRVVRLALAVVVLVALWWFWPQSLGGQVAYVKVDGQSMYPTYHFGDLAVVRRQSDYRIGDPVAYRIPKGEFGAGAVVIHRLVAGDGVRGYTTRGDNKRLADPWHPRTNDILGRVEYHLPGFGTKLAALSRPLYLGALVGVLTMLTMFVPARRSRRRTAARDVTDGNPSDPSDPASPQEQPAIANLADARS